ncbi:hypothetical protein FH972_026321 [Carpinus fangiana]|uniref:Uncharacterized protein n=1 Tax=Carpinus fangiana TaxID=176857 RepID=A0A5N6L4M1_9ROSI|nr:hypothetical protein FH972_026321 [Carpinus fangiana]
MASDSSDETDKCDVEALPPLACAPDHASSIDQVPPSETHTSSEPTPSDAEKYWLYPKESFKQWRNREISLELAISIFSLRWEENEQNCARTARGYHSFSVNRLARRPPWNWETHWTPDDRINSFSEKDIDHSATTVDDSNLEMQQQSPSQSTISQLFRPIQYKYKYTSHYSSLSKGWIVVGLLDAASGVPVERIAAIDLAQKVGLFTAVRRAVHSSRGLRRFASLKSVRGFGIYECDQDACTHRRIALDSQTQASLREFFHDYQSGRSGAEYVWDKWIYEKLNESKSRPREGRFSLEIILGWSPTRLLWATAVPVMLSIAIGSWLTTRLPDDVGAAWTIASYIVTTAAWYVAVPEHGRQADGSLHGTSGDALKEEEPHEELLATGKTGNPSAYRQTWDKRDTVRCRQEFEASLHLLVRIAQRPDISMLPAPHAVGLLLREALGHDSRVVAQAGDLADLGVADLACDLAVGALVHGDDDGAAQAQVVLQAGVGAVDETVVSPAAQMPGELSALRDAGGAERVALGDEAAGGVDDHAAAVGDVAAADHLVGGALVAQPERVDDAHLVGGEAVVQLAYLDVARLDAGLGECRLRGALVHAVAHEVDGGAREDRLRVGHHALAGDEDGLLLEVRPGVEEGLGDEHGGGAAVGGGAALQLGEGLEDGGRVHDLLVGVLLLELRVGVALGVLVVDARNLGKVFLLRAVLLHVFAAGVAKLLRGKGGVGHTTRLLDHLTEGAGRVDTIVPVRSQGAGVHLLKANDQDTVSSAVLDQVAAHEEAGGAGGAVVVYIVNGDASQAELVEDALAAGGVTVDIACNALLDVIVVDVGVEHGLDAGLVAKLCVVDLAAGLDELGHAHAEDVDGAGSLLAHVGCFVG